MSIEMENPKTLMEKIDAAANLVEQMSLAHTIKDESHFKKCHKEAGELLFDAINKLVDDDEYSCLQGKMVRYRYVDWEQDSFTPWAPCTINDIKKFEDKSIDIIQFKP